MIFVAGGTQDSRELVKFLLAKNFTILLSVTTTYAKELITPHPNLSINAHPLDAETLPAILKKYHISAFIDATHPYATVISELAINTCQKLTIPYIRYERACTAVMPKQPLLHYVNSYEEAATLASQLGKTIFITTGSRHLSAFQKYLPTHRLFLRIIPLLDSLQAALEAGFSPQNIIAMQGRFSKDFNLATYKMLNANVIVTKDSGHIGGTDTKIAAAEELNIPVVIIQRPPLSYPEIRFSFSEIAVFLERNNLC